MRKVVNKSGRYFGHFTSFGSRSEILVSDEIKYFINGSLLGDGHITKYKFSNTSSTNKNSKLSIKHSGKQIEYNLFKRSILDKLYLKTYFATGHFLDKRNDNIYIFNTVETIQNVYFNKYRDIWYIDNKKEVPNNIELNELSLAIWFQDDGMICGNRSSYTLCTNSFSEDSIEILRSILFNKFNVETTIQTNKRGEHMIYIRKKSLGIFNDLILPYIHESMKYKTLSA